MRLRRLATVIAVAAVTLLPATSLVAEFIDHITVSTSKDVHVPGLRNGLDHATEMRPAPLTDTVLRITRFNHGTPLALGPGTLGITKKSSITVPEGAPRVKKATYTLEHWRDGVMLASTDVLVKFKKNGKAKGGESDLRRIDFREGDVLELKVTTDREFADGTRLEVELEFLAFGFARSGAHEAGR